MATTMTTIMPFIDFGIICGGGLLLGKCLRIPMDIENFLLPFSFLALLPFISFRGYTSAPTAECLCRSRMVLGTRLTSVAAAAGGETFDDGEYKGEAGACFSLLLRSSNANLVDQYTSDTFSLKSG